MTNINLMIMMMMVMRVLLSGAFWICVWQDWQSWQKTGFALQVFSHYRHWCCHHHHHYHRWSSSPSCFNLVQPAMCSASPRKQNKKQLRSIMNQSCLVTLEVVYIYQEFDFDLNWLWLAPFLTWRNPRCEGSLWGRQRKWESGFSGVYSITMV